MSTGIDPIDSAPLIIRTYNDDSADNTFLLTRYDYPVSSNYVLRTSANGSLAPSDALTQTTMGMSSMTISNHFGSTMVYDTFSSGTLFLPSGVFDTIVKTTMTASSVTASTIFLNVLNICTMNASTFSPNGVTVAYTTLGSTVQTSSMTYSTLIGDSISGNTGFVTTLFGSSIYATSTFAAAMASDTSRLSTLVMDSTIVGFLSFSTLQGNTLIVNTLSGSSIYTNPLTVSTLDGGLLVTSTISCTTLSVSSLYASGLVFSTTIGSSVVMSTMTAPLLFSHSLSFSTAQGSTVTVSSATVSSLYASLLVGSTLQTNTLVFSTLTASSINTSELIYSTAQGSTMLVSTIGVSTLSVGAFAYSTLSGSSMMTNTILLASTLTGSTISWNHVVLSTLQGSSAMISSVTASTVLGSAVVAASLQGSTVLVSTAIGSSLNTNFLSASTILSDSLFFSTMSVSTLVNNSAVYSTLQGSTATLSTLTASTLFVSTMMASTLNGSSAVCSTLTTSSIQSDGIVFSTLHGGTLLLSTLASCTINAQTISVSTLQGSTVTVSTLTGSTIVSGQLAYSTLIGSTIVTDYINATSTCTGNGTLLLSTLAFSTQQTTTAFLSTLIVTSTLTVSTLNRINPTSFTASTLTLSGGLQANTATGLLVCSSLNVNAMNLSRSIVNQPVYGNSVKTDSIVAPGQSLVRTSGIRATIDQMPNQQQTYTFGAAIPNRWVAVGTGANSIAYSNDGFNWIGLAKTIFLQGKGVAWNGSMWVAVGDTINTIAYSYDGIKWTGLGASIFSNAGNRVAWNGSMWVATGSGTNSIAYSYDGINWSGLGESIFPSAGFGVAWNGTMWVAVGGGINTIAYSYDGINWTGLGKTIFSGGGYDIAWNGTMWIAVGYDSNMIAYSYNGINWTGLGTSIFLYLGYGVAWNGIMWVAVGWGTNTIAYSYNGINWTGLGTSIFPNNADGVAWNGAMWVVLGGGTNTIAYSYNGITWTGFNSSVISGASKLAYNGQRPHRITFPAPITVATGSGTNTLAYSTDGITWTGNGLGMFSTQGNGVATNGSMWVATGSGTNTLAYSSTSDTPYIHLPFENSTYEDVMGNSTVTAYGSPAFVTGTIGSKAVNLANTAGVTAVKYIRGTWTGASNVTVSGWFNPRTLNSTYQIIFSAYSTFFAVLINPSNQLTALVPSGGGSNYVNVGSSYVLTVNTWYYFSLIFQTNGVCSLYLNNALLGGITNSQGVGSLTTSVFELSGYDSNQAFAFNGYIDDFRLYNYAVTVNPRITWRGLGTSIFSTQGNGVAWNGNMWVAVGSGTNSIAYSYDGVTWIGLGLLVLTQGNAVAWSGSMWVAVGSGANSIAYSYNGITWTGSSLYNTQWNGVAWNGSMWIAVGSGPNIMAYSYDGINWTSLSSVFVPSAYLPLENSFVDTFGSLISPTMVGSVTYSTSIRKIGTYAAYFNNTPGNYAPINYLEYLTPPSFHNPTAFTVSFWMYHTAQNILYAAVPVSFNDRSGASGLYFYATDYGISVTFSSTTDIFISTGAYYPITSTYLTWTHVAFTFAIVNGSGIGILYVNGVAQASRTTEGTGGLCTSNNRGPMTYLHIGCLTPWTGAYAGYVDDVRIYTSTLPPSLITALYNSTSPPVYLSETTPLFTSSGNGVAWNGNRWVAVGSGGNTIVYSTNGLTWLAAASSCFTTAGNGVTWNGTRWVTVGSGTNAIGFSSDGSTWTSKIVQTTLSPQFTSLATYTWIQNGVAWAVSASSTYSGLPLYAYGAFNNYIGSSGTYSWASALSTYSASSPFACTSGVSTTIQGVGAVVGEWLQLQSSAPLIMRSYTYGCGGFLNIPKNYYIVGSNDGSTWYPIQSSSMTTNPLTVNYSVCSTYITVNQSGIQTIIGGQTGSGSFTTYATTTNAYTYFRIIATNTFGAGTLFELGEWYINFASPFLPNPFDSSRYYYHYTLYNGATVTPSIYKPYTPSITLVAGSSQYIQTANFTPTTAGLSFAFWYKSNASGTWGRVFDFGNGNGSDNILCSPNANDGVGINRFGFSCYYGPTGNNFYLTDINYNDNTWRHVVWTLVYAAAGSTTSVWNIYINGVFKATTTSYYPNTAVSRTLSYIGRSNWVSDAYYNGNIDDYRIYNSVLTATQVTTIYSGSVYDGTYNTAFSTAGSGIVSNNTLSGTVMIQHPVVAVGQGTHSLAYSPDGVQWTGLGTSVFTTGYCVCWNGSKWIAGGLGTNTLAYSYDGVRWTGLGSTVFSTQANGIAWNGSIWVAVGSGINTIVYSTDGIVWISSANTIFTSCNAVAWNGKQWIAVGTGTKSIAYSADGIAWTAMSSTDVFTQGNGICWTGSLWIAVGAGINTIAYSLDGMSWTGLGNTIFSTSGNGICWNGTRWIAVGTGSAHTIAYSADGIAWIGFGKTIFSTAGNGVCWTGSRFVAVGNGSTISYSQDGITWYTTVSSIFSTQGNGVAGNPRLGATVSDSQVALSESLDVVSDTYYNTGYTNFSATIQSQTYRT